MHALRVLPNAPVATKRFEKASPAILRRDKLLPCIYWTIYREQFAFHRAEEKGRFFKESILATKRFELEEAFLHEEAVLDTPLTGVGGLCTAY